MQMVSLQSFLKIVTFVFFIFNAHFTYSFASTDDENTISKIFETHGKTNVVNFILERNRGKITIQKKKSFISSTGRPDLTYITAKSVNHDLKNLKIDVSSLDTELDIYIDKVSKKQQKMDDSLKRLDSESDTNEIPLSTKLKHQVKITQAKYNAAESDYERKQLKYELTRLQREYKKAKYNEKHNPDASLSNKSSPNKKNYKSTSYCESYKSQLQKLTESSYRYQAFFCNERSYRVENPKSCSNYKYRGQSSLKEYKEKINKLRQNISKHCKS